MVPIPPLKEQERIVVEMAKWASLITSIKNDKEDLQAAIKQTKSKILDLAIHGKLEMCIRDRRKGKCLVLRKRTTYKRNLVLRLSYRRETYFGDQ